MFQLWMALLVASNLLAPTTGGSTTTNNTASISGTVLDEATGEFMAFAFLELRQNAQTIQTTEADFDGNYQFSNLAAGTYDIHCSYVGYPPVITQNIRLRLGQYLQQNIVFPKTASGSSSGTTHISTVNVVEAHVPIMELGSYTTGGQTLGAEDIMMMSTRNIGSIAATTVGVQQKDEGDDIWVNGVRSSSVDMLLSFTAAGAARQQQKALRQQEKIAHRQAQIMAKQEAAKKKQEAIAAQKAQKAAEKIKQETAKEEELPPLPPAPPLVVENAPLSPRQEPQSTFSIDVDNAAYTQIRHSIAHGTHPQPQHLRIEEMINYFTYDYPKPAPDAPHPFSVFTELSDCPWNPNARILHIGLQGGDAPPIPQPKNKSDFDKTTDSTQTNKNNYVFLIDVSGSMSGNSIALVKDAMRRMIEQMQPDDQAAIVVYAGAAGLVQPVTKGTDRQALLDALTRLEAGGSTAGSAGILLAYQTAHDHYIQQGNNRVILATDGDFNVGVSSLPELEQLIEKEREKGVFLTVLGVGTWHNNDAIMELLADKGNGMYFYLDNMTEAQRIAQMSGTLTTIAKDVKLQIEFDSNTVQTYRLLGYENRKLANQDFANDLKDAGDLGQGHTVTAIYELVLMPHTRPQDHILDLRLRYKKPHIGTSQLLEYTMTNDYHPIAKASDNLCWAAAVAGWGLILRRSSYIQRTFQPADVLHLAGAHLGEDKNNERQGFIDLVYRWQALPK